LEKAAKERFIQFLKNNKHKITQERLMVLDEVFGRHDHFEAEELVEELKKNNLPVSRATVYRTLELLVLCGLVTKDNFGGSSAKYEHIFGHKHHDHIIDIEDGTIIEFVDEKIEKLQEEIAEKYGYELIKHVMQLYGKKKKIK
jgi:Fur family ferric uptake transcriptional regulator